MEKLNLFKNPEIRVYAGPNGSGKSTFSTEVEQFGYYINADDIKSRLHTSDLDAAIIAEQAREESIDNMIDFSFETVLSTERNLNLLARAKEKGYFIKCFYVITSSSQINIQRVKYRENLGGHGVDEKKIISRYKRALDLLPKLVEICDIVHIYDNSDYFVRIFKKRKNKCYYYENIFWTKSSVSKLTNIPKDNLLLATI
jgi:predicted ABC-type ATPase